MTTSEPETPEVEPETAPREGLAAIVGGYFERLRGGEVGILPVLIGLGVITLYFWSKNHNFVTAVNFNNIVVQMAGVSIIAMGIVFVLLLGRSTSRSATSAASAVSRSRCSSSQGRATRSPA